MAIKYNLNSGLNASNAALTGTSDNDYLDGSGGGYDMAGYAGDDTYYVDDASDTVTEAYNEGTDEVHAAISWTLGDHVENLVLTGSGSIDGTGNGLDNVIVGNAGDNILSGGDGSDFLCDDNGGLDTLIGGDGNDGYQVSSSTTVVVEAADGGVDEVDASVSYVLSDNVDYLRLSGSDDLTGTGNAGFNWLMGNSGDNRLDGQAGADHMTGYDGDDTYIVDDANDLVTEADDEGTDTVEASVSFTLDDYIENLTLTGTDNIDGTGNGLANGLTGNSGENRLDGGSGADVMAGGDGNDTYVVDDAHDAITEGSGPSGGDDGVEASITWALGANLENLILTGTSDIDGTGNALDNQIFGNAGDNRLSGGAGTDYLIGFDPIAFLAGGLTDGGHDTLIGGDDNDLYAVLTADTVIVEAQTGGMDAVYALCSYTLPDNVEGIIAVLPLGDFTFRGNSGANVLIGNDGNDSLNGMGGADQMQGRDGNDVYYVNLTADVVSETDNNGDDTGGIDKVYASADYTLGDHVENLTLTGTADLEGTGNGENNALHGNDGDNILTGLGGNDVLAGGAGADTMYGGAGDDTYYIDDSGDRAIETGAGDGSDRVYVSVSWTASDFIEAVVAGGSDDIELTGNGLNNLLKGNGGDNVLDGGLGADTMTGGAGDDTYFADDSGDRVQESAGGGTDLVIASVSHALRSHVENLTLTGTDNLSGKGNDLDNVIHGNAGNNALNGMAGGDTLYGGAGDDSYYVDDLMDRVSESSDTLHDDGGTDRVTATVSFTLGAFVENLSLAGTDTIDATGNELANSLRGNDAANRIEGMGGSDKLYGGGGADSFVFEAAGDNGLDRITDFVSGVDHLVFMTADYGASPELTIGRAAVGSAAQFVFNAGNHTLYWDADGDGGQAAIALAVFSGVTVLQTSDFLFE